MQIANIIKIIKIILTRLTLFNNFFPNLIRLPKTMDPTSNLSVALKNQSKEELFDKVRGCIYGQFIGDSLAMPVHWYYDINQLKKDFGQISKYEAPKQNFQNSILNLSNTDGPGRGSYSGNLIGEVILHGKKKFWQRGKSFHYHHGMLAGENTLDTQITRVLYRNLVKNKQFLQSDFLQDFIKFMTTPDTHSDIYASSAIRIFFKNWSLGKALENCPGDDKHNVEAIDALVITVPVILANLFATEEKRNEEVKNAILATRLAHESAEYAVIYADLLRTVLLKEKGFKEAIAEAAGKIGFDVQKEVQRLKGKSDPMTACYIDSSFPVLLFYAYKYAESPEEAVLASANGGGENVARGALIGALVGAEHGLSKFPKNLVGELVEKEKISSEMEEFIATFMI